MYKVIRKDEKQNLEETEKFILEKIAGGGVPFLPRPSTPMDEARIRLFTCFEDTDHWATYVLQEIIHFLISCLTPHRSNYFNLCPLLFFAISRPPPVGELLLPDARETQHLSPVLGLLRSDPCTASG